MRTFLLILVFGIIIGWAIAHLFVQGFLTPWYSLGRPSEQPTEIISINDGIWVKAKSGSIYNLPENKVYYFEHLKCTELCWTKFDSAPQDQDNLYPPEECDVYIPSVKKFAISKIVCESSGPARILLVYAINKEGEIYFWHNAIGDMDNVAYMLFPGGIGGFIVLCGVLYWAAMYRMEY